MDGMRYSKCRRRGGFLIMWFTQPRMISRMDERGGERLHWEIKDCDWGVLGVGIMCLIGIGNWFLHCLQARKSLLLRWERLLLLAMYL